MASLWVSHWRWRALADALAAARDEVKAVVKHESARRQRSALWPGQVGRVLDGEAEAGRADHGAVTARSGSARHLVPVRVLEAAVEQFLEPVVSSVLPWRAASATIASARSISPGAAGRCGTSASTSAPRSLPDCDDECVLAFRHEFW